MQAPAPIKTCRPIVMVERATMEAPEMPVCSPITMVLSSANAASIVGCGSPAGLLSNRLKILTLFPSVMSAPGARVMIGIPAKEQPVPILKPRQRSQSGTITRSIVRRTTVCGLRTIRRSCRRNRHPASMVRLYRSNPAADEQHNFPSDSVMVLSISKERGAVACMVLDLCARTRDSSCRPQSSPPPS